VSLNTETEDIASTPSISGEVLSGLFSTSLKGVNSLSRLSSDTLNSIALAIVLFPTPLTPYLIFNTPSKILIDASSILLQFFIFNSTGYDILF
jgi:hypothetical protein